MKDKIKIKHLVSMALCVGMIAALMCWPACQKRPREAAGKFEMSNLPPSDWVPMRASNGVTLFRKHDPEMGIMVNTYCERYQDVPLTPLSRDLFFGLKNLKEISRSKTKVDGHDAEEATMDCSLDGTPVTVKAYTFKAEGCIYDIAYFASPEHFNEGLKEFDEFVGGFKVGK